MRIKKENDKLGNIIEEQRRELNHQRKEIIALDSEKKSIERSDHKVHGELRDLRIYLSELKNERDRITSEVLILK